MSQIKPNPIYETAAAPVDGNSARVIRPGKGYTIDVKSHMPEWDAPPVCVPPSRFPRTRDFQNLIGIRKGRLRVVGLLPGGGGKWLVKCACGVYTYRKSAAIKKVFTDPAAHHDACRQCTALAFLKREEHYRRTGKDANIQDYF